jgi:hypothetical protein
MKLIQIIRLVNNGHNLIFYDKSVSICYHRFKDKYFCIYFDEPVPIRIRLINMIKLINSDYKFKESRITISELKEVIVNILNEQNLIILFNNFQQLSKSAILIYEYLNNRKNIQFICSFNSKFKKEAYNFYKTFKLINREDYSPNRIQINITYAIYALLSIYCFLFYIKISNSIYMATIVIGGVWFALIIFRTLMYAGGRI